jgi:hypothetical protein
MGAVLQRRRNRRLPRPVAKMAPINLGATLEADEVNRAIDDVVEVANRATDGSLAGAAAPFDVDLAVGTNKISHGLGRPVIGFLWIPRTAGAAAPGFDPNQPGNATPDRQVWITASGAGRYRLILF